MSEIPGVSERPDPADAPHGSARRTGKAVVAVAASLVFAVTGAGWATTQWLDGQVHRVIALDPGSTSITDARAQYGDENVLLVGSDTRRGAVSADGVGDASVIPGARSDTVMIAHVAADRSRAVIVSFPRDLQIQRPPCAVWDPATRSYSDRVDPGASVAKLNSAYEIGGPLCVTKVVQQLSGLAVTRFVGIDFQGFKALVDALGGVSVCVERPLRDRELGEIVPQSGYHRFTGETALNYVRARHVVGDPTSDYGRITRQQRFLSALLRQLLSPGVLLNPGRLGTVVGAVTANTVGENIDSRDLLDLARSLEGLDPAHVLFVTVPTTGYANADGNEELRMRDNAALFRAVIDGTALPGDQPAPTPSATPPVAQPADPRVGERLVGTVPPPGPTPSAVTRATSQPTPEPTPEPTVAADAPTVHLPDPGAHHAPVRVLNGARVAGVAGDAARELRDAGYEVVEVGDAPAPVNATVLRYPPSLEAQALALLAATPDAVLQPDQTLTDTMVLVVGPDFGGVTPGAAELPTTPPAPGPLETVNGADDTCS